MSRPSLAFQNSDRYETLGQSPISASAMVSDGRGVSAESRQDEPVPEVSAEASEIQDALSRNEQLRRTCEDLEELVVQLRNEGDVFKMKTSMTLSMYQSRLMTMTIDKEKLSEQCDKLQGEISEVREENLSRQLEILALERLENGDISCVAALQDGKERENVQKN